MALKMKDKFARIQLAKLPADVKSEAEMIRDITENFSDPDLCEAAQDNFDELYGIIEKQHPEALKVGKAAKVPAGTKKKKAEAKPAAPKKSEDPYGFKVGDTVYIINDEEPYFDKDYPAYRVSKVTSDDPYIFLERLDDGEKVETKEKYISKNLPAGNKRESMKDVKLDECKKMLREADYDISKKLVKGKRVIKKKKRSDKAIIKEKGSDFVATVKKDIKPTAPRKDKWEKELDEIGELFAKLMQKIDNIVHQDRDMVKLGKIKAFLKELID